MNINFSFLKKVLIVIVSLLYGIEICAQKNISNHKQLYQSAYREINGMLSGQQKINFKKAVFLWKTLI